jgi:hypothetical protein
MKKTILITVAIFGIITSVSAQKAKNALDKNKSTTTTTTTPKTKPFKTDAVKTDEVKQNEPKNVLGNSKNNEVKQNGVQIKNTDIKQDESKNVLGDSKNNEEKKPENRAQKSVTHLDKVVGLTEEQKTKIYGFSLTRVNKIDAIKEKYKGKETNHEDKNKEIAAVKQEYRANTTAILTTEQLEKLKSRPVDAGSGQGGGYNGKEKDHHGKGHDKGHENHGNKNHDKDHKEKDSDDSFGDED